jgi:restriction system protein
VIEQVKAYKPAHLVAANDVRALIGVLQGDGASKACLSTTSDFAPMIKTDPFIHPLIPSRLELVNGTALFSRLEELATRHKT